MGGVKAADTNLPMEALPTILMERARREPDRPYLDHVDGATLTFGQLELLTRQWMARLEAYGVSPGDRVATLLPVSFDGIALWLATARLGGLHIAINGAHRGNVLRHMLTDAGCRLLITTAAYREPVADILLSIEGLSCRIVEDPSEEDGKEAAVELGRTVSLAPWDLASIMYTSGTTGLSKGVMVTWRQTFETARWLVSSEEIGRGDAWYCPWPLHHVSGQLALMSSAASGARLVLRDGFSLSSFWQDVRTFGCTTVLLPGTTLSYIASASADPRDRDHSLRRVLAAPLPADTKSLIERFGFRMRTCFNMTETSTPIVSGWDPGPVGSCGRARPGVECRVVDEHDQEVAPGTSGELVLRCERSWEVMAGYLNRPDATVEAWRNLWFHTGDLFRCDSEGNFFFVDRLKHSIRRGGENVSSTELEAEIMAHEGVLDCAVVGVPSEYGEEDIQAFVVPVAPEAVSVEALIAFLRPRISRFMLPRYVVLMEDLPKTHTHRAKKEELKALDVADRRWDRLAQSVEGAE